jgi:hypothetical protein
MRLVAHKRIGQEVSPFRQLRRAGSVVVDISENVCARGANAAPLAI